MMDHVWLVNAPVSTADARNLLLSLLSVIRFLINAISFLMPKFIKEDIIKSSQMSHVTNKSKLFQQLLKLFLSLGH